VQIVRNLSLTYIISWGKSGPISCKHIVQTCFVPFFTVCNLRLIFILYQKWNVTFSAINVNRHAVDIPDAPSAVGLPPGLPIRS
jgi:hypothetical protein